MAVTYPALVNCLWVRIVGVWRFRNCVLYRLCKWLVNLLDRLFTCLSRWHRSLTVLSLSLREAHRAFQLDIKRQSVTARDEPELVWRLLRHQRGLSDQFLDLSIALLTLSGSQTATVLARSATTSSHHWILVRNTAFTTLIIWVGICGIILLIQGCRLRWHQWWPVRLHLLQWLRRLVHRHLQYVRLACLQVYTCNLCLPTLDSCFFLSDKLLREEEFLGSEHLGIFQCVQLGFFLQFLLLLLASHRPLRLRLWVPWGCLSLMSVDWCTGGFPCSAGRDSCRSCFGKWASLLLRLWSRHGTEIKRVPYKINLRAESDMFEDISDSGMDYED